MKSIISSYKQFKINSLNKLCMFIKECKDETSKIILNRYIENYFNAKFYNLYETVEDNSRKFDLLLLKEEYDGLELELEDTYSNYPEEIRAYKKISYFVCNIDRIYEDTDELRSLLEDNISKTKYIELMLEDKKEKYIEMYIKMAEKENKIFQTKIDDSFSLTMNEHNDLKIVNLEYDIKIIQEKYRKNLINQVYKDKKLYLNKAINILEKISYIILRKKCYEIEDEEKYIIFLPNELIVDGDFHKELKETLNNRLLCKKISVALTDEVLLNKQRIYNNKVKLSCYRDMTYVTDFSKKFQSVLALPIEYFIITNYKTKRESELIGYIESDDRVIVVEENN